MGVAASRVEARHRSLNCRVPTMVEFLNDTPYTVHTVWIDYNGNERRYFALAPGARVRQPTFTAHPWTFDAPDAPGSVCVVDSQAVFYPPPLPPPPADDDEPPGLLPLAHIQLASAVRWDLQQHARFPPAWHAAAATLLLCHHRLAAQASSVRDDGHLCSCASPTARQPPLGQQQERGGVQVLLTRLRRMGSSISSPPPPAAAGRAAAHTAPLPSGTHLGHLPKELVLEVLAAAAPEVPHIVKPPLPHGVQTGEVGEVAAAELFRPAVGEEAEAVAEAEAGEH